MLVYDVQDVSSDQLIRFNYDEICTLDNQIILNINRKWQHTAYGLYYYFSWLSYNVYLSLSLHYYNILKRSTSARKVYVVLDTIDFLISHRKYEPGVHIQCKQPQLALSSMYTFYYIGLHVQSNFVMFKSTIYITRQCLVFHHSMTPCIIHYVTCITDTIHFLLVLYYT